MHIPRSSATLRFSLKKYNNATNRCLRGQKPSRDNRFREKLYVFSIWVLDTVHQALILKTLYVYFVREFGNFQYLNHLQRSLIDIAIFTGVIDAMVQIIFVRRAWHLSEKNRILTGALIAAVLGQVAVTMVYFGQVFNFTQLTQLQSVFITERITNAIVFFTDTFIVIVLVYLLWRHRTDSRRGDTVVKRLIKYTISTGLITEIWGLLSLIFVEALPNTFVYLLADLTIPKLYINCMLTLLNARSNLQRTLGDVECSFFDRESLPVQFVIKDSPNAETKAIYFLIYVQYESFRNVSVIVLALSDCLARVTDSGPNVTTHQPKFGTLQCQVELSLSSITSGPYIEQWISVI
ncbi:hypothetical protein A7U60_g4591 [Sanghuangporus baumii]|uniref:DUF6534 domain-containing protein n=1 Tax=Sanghuangporus baumii TaxID=108892 RepID=A0A9Q5HYM1_SANBA|nr:hypothetical protein A7U60_g4591 [Sanghuangporus baumii]